MRQFVYYRFLHCVCLALSLPFVVSLTSCGGEEEDEPTMPVMPTGTTETSSESEASSIEGVVKANISVRAQYSDYISTFTITSTLKDALPDKSFDFGVGHRGYEASEIINVSFGSQAYSYQKSTSGNTETIVLKNPFWYYYAMVEIDRDKLAYCEMYYSTYVALSQRSWSDLSSDERALYNDVKDYLDRCFKEVKADYRQVIYARDRSTGKGYQLGVYRLS